MHGYGKCQTIVRSLSRALHNQPGLTIMGVYFESIL